MQRQTPMAKRTLFLGGAVAGAVLLLTGCCTVKRGNCFTACCDNIANQIPVITCQPLNVTNAIPGEPARFYAEAQGQSLTYQWFFIGGGNPEPQDLNLPTARQPLLEIPSVGPAHYGLYFCQVESAGNVASVVQTRQAALGGLAASGAAGPFASVQNPVGSGTSITVCTINVGNKKVAYGAQTPDAPNNGFLGEALAVTTDGTTFVTNAILNTRYVLQFNHTSTNKPCAVPVANTTNLVQCNPASNNALIAGKSYYLTVFFKANQAPSTGTQVILSGTWTQ